MNHESANSKPKNPSLNSEQRPRAEAERSAGCAEALVQYDCNMRMVHACVFLCGHLACILLKSKLVRQDNLPPGDPHGITHVTMHRAPDALELVTESVVTSLGSL